MKLGLAGTGMIVTEVLPVLKELDIFPEAILSTEQSREKAAKLAEKYSIPRCFTDYDKFLAADIDTVYLGIPNSLHFEYARRALLAGKNVIAEKPIAVSSSELTELRCLAESQGKILLEAMTLRHLPAYRALKNDLPLLGELRIVTLNFSQYSSRYDRFLQGDIAPAFDPAQCGGALMDLNVYNIHLLAGLFGEPKSVRYSPNIQRGVDTSGVLTLDYGGMTAVSVAAKDCQGANFSSIQGEKGRIDFTDTLNGLSAYTAALRSGETIRRDFNEGLHRMTYEFRDFRRIIDEGAADEAALLLDISQTAMKILDDARGKIR